MTRRYTSEIINDIGPERDIPAPDVGTDGRVMAWIFDTYSMNKGHSVLGVVTGKPLSIGGSLGREEATARGALYCIQGLSVKQGKRVTRLLRRDPGVRQRRRHLARLLHLEGAKVVAVSDSRGGVYNPNGIDVPAALAHKQEHGSPRGARERGGDHERGAHRAAVRHLRALRARAGRDRGERRPGQGDDHLRGRERAGHARRPT